jgi:tetratricopeptide (TPR) repeat protein
MPRWIALVVLAGATQIVLAGIYGTNPPDPFEMNPDGTAKPLTFEQFKIRLQEREGLRNPNLEKTTAAREAIQKRAANEPPLERTADWLSLGQAGDVVTLLTPRTRDRELNYELLANLAHAHAQRGEWDEAVSRMGLAQDAELPANASPYWKWKKQKIDAGPYMRWLRLRRDEAAHRPPVEDALPPAIFGASAKPKDVIAIVQQMVLDEPSDTYLLWLLGELYAEAGDVKSAYNLLDYCGFSRGLTQPKALRAKRDSLKIEVDKLGNQTNPDDLLLSQPTATDPPPAAGLFDIIPPEKFWPIAIVSSIFAIGLLGLQIRAIRKRRRRSHAT